MQKLSSSEERFRRLTDLSSDWYWEQDAGLRFSMISSGLKSIAGIAPENLIGKNIKEITSGVRHNDWDALRMAMESFEPFTNFEGCARDDNGTVRWLSVSGAPLFDAAGVFSGYYGTGRDITGRKQIEELVQFQAHHDALTGLPNRTLLNERLELMIARAASDHHEIWVLFLDLDRFKRINDSLGHKIGDVLLQQISQRMHAVLRKTDIIARLGGDEFVLALSDVETGSQSFSLLQHIMEAASAPVMIGDSELATSCSVGIAVYPSDGATADVLIEHADIAMYRAKETGRNNYQFYKPEMNERAMDRLRLESDLRNALQDDEFVLHYQPQIDLVTNEIVGVEALLRWRHPTSGLLGPAQFIGVAEDIGLIMPIGDWVLREACSQATHWLKNGYPPIRVAVNLSARQFAHQNLVHSVSSALQSSGLDGNLLEIEITESLMMSNMEQTVNILRELKSLGVHVSVDDFGTGYSSLYYLKRFPIDVLKIDRSFVRDITIDPDDAAIVSAIISLAHNLGLRVTAEGVEQQDQLDYLAHYGCDVVQGYLFSRPIDAGAFESLLSQGILWAHECMTARSQYAHGPGGHNQCSYCSQCGTS